VDHRSDQAQLAASLHRFMGVDGYDLTELSSERCSPHGE
jgi:hypothetical protein